MPDVRVRYRVWKTVSRVTGQRRDIAHWFQDDSGQDRKLPVAQAHAVARGLARQHASEAEVVDGTAVLACYVWDRRKKEVVVRG